MKKSEEKQKVKRKKTLVKLENVKKIYLMGEVEVHALRGINLEIKENEFVAITGPSGSGKSTMMNMIGSLDTPTSGTVELDSVNIADIPESDLASIRGKTIGFIFQSFNLLPTLTALENVELPLMFLGVDSSERKRMAEAFLKRFGLSDRINHLPSELSGGQQQRVAIARALVVDPEIILADEPTGNLDLKTGEEIMKLLKELYKDGKTVVVITHEEYLTKYAERVIRLSDGNIVKDDDGKRK